MTKDEYYKEFQSELKLDLPKMTKADAIAYYGYFSAYYDLGHLSADHLDKLIEQIPLTMAEQQNISL